MNSSSKLIFKRFFEKWGKHSSSKVSLENPAKVLIVLLTDICEIEREFNSFIEENSIADLELMDFRIRNAEKNLFIEKLLDKLIERIIKNE